MNFRKVALLSLIGGLGFGAAACTDGYGYSGVNVGYGSAGYYGDPYDGPYYGSNGYLGAGYGNYGWGGPSYYGWYDNFYYPGTGYYVYDRGRRAHRWNPAQQAYWQGRRGNFGNNRPRDNWRDFHRGNRAYQPGSVNRDQFQGRRDTRWNGGTRGFTGNPARPNPGVTGGPRFNGAARDGGMRGGGRSAGSRDRR